MKPKIVSTAGLLFMVSTCALPAHHDPQQYVVELIRSGKQREAVEFVRSYPESATFNAVIEAYGVGNVEVAHFLILEPGMASEYLLNGLVSNPGKLSESQFIDEYELIQNICKCAPSPSFADLLLLVQRDWVTAMSRVFKDWSETQRKTALNKHTNGYSGFGVYELAKSKAMRDFLAPYRDVDVQRQAEKLREEKQRQAENAALQARQAELQARRAAEKQALEAARVDRQNEAVHSSGIPMGADAGVATPDSGARLSCDCDRNPDGTIRKLTGRHDADGQIALVTMSCADDIDVSGNYIIWDKTACTPPEACRTYLGKKETGLIGTAGVSDWGENKIKWRIVAEEKDGTCVPAKVKIDNQAITKALRLVWLFDGPPGGTWPRGEAPDELKFMIWYEDPTGVYTGGEGGNFVTGYNGRQKRTK